LTFDGNVDVVLVVGVRRKIGPRDMFGVESDGWGRQYGDLLRVVLEEEEGRTFGCWLSGGIVGDATSQSRWVVRLWGIVAVEGESMVERDIGVVLFAAVGVVVVREEMTVLLLCECVVGETVMKLPLMSNTAKKENNRW
jgi:hypothetical protein